MNRLGYATIYLLLYGVGATTAPDNVTTALGVVEGSTFPAPIAVAAKRFVDLIIHGNIFIDKTAMIKELFQMEMVVREGTWSFFVRPPGWGKSVILDMFKTFFEIHVDAKTHQIIPNEQTTGYRLFEHGQVVLPDGTVRKLRDPLLVSEDAAFMFKHQGRYITVHMNLGGLKAKNMEEMKKAVAARMRLAFKPYDYDYVATALGTDPLLIDEMARRIRAENTNWTTFGQICDTLKNYYKRELILLVENYDDPLTELLVHSVSNKEQVASRFMTFYREFFEMLEKTTFYRRLMVTGMNRMWFDRCYLMQFEWTDELRGEPFYLYHGFSEKEMRMIFDHLGTPTNVRERLAERYSGYQFNRQELNTYNPRSVVKFLASQKMENYWTPKPSVDAIFTNLLAIPLFRCMLLSFDILSLRENKTTYSPHLLHKEYIVQPRLEKFARFFENPRPIIDNENITSLTRYYYKAAGLEVAQYLLRGHGYLTASYHIPNKEVWALIRAKLLSYYSSELKYKGNADDDNSTLNALCEKFASFMLSKQNHSIELEEVFLNFLDDLQVFGFPDDDSISEIDMSQVYVACDVLNFIGVRIRGFRIGYSGIAPTEQGVVGGGMTFTRHNLTIFLHMIVNYAPVEMAPVSRTFAAILRHVDRNNKNATLIRRIGIYYEPTTKYLTIIGV